MPCKNICVNFKNVKTVTGSPYLEGEKWCAACCIFIEWEGIHCPCCTRKLRVNPRSKKRSWCYATLRSIRLSLDEDEDHDDDDGNKLVKAENLDRQLQQHAHKKRERERILVKGRLRDRRPVY